VHARLGQLCEAAPDLVEDLDVRGGVAARRPADRLLVDADDLVELIEAEDRAVVPDAAGGAVVAARQRRGDHVVYEGRLARARDARHRRQHAERELHVEIREVVLAGAGDLQASGGAPPAHRQRDLPAAGEVGARQRASVPLEALRRSGVDDAPARHAGPWPEVDHVVRAPDRLLVVLDHHHRVADVAHALEPDVAHALERGEQPPVVALVQADRGLVEDVDHARELGAHLARQPDPLGFASRERGARAVEREVAEAHRGEEVETPADLLQHLDRDLARGAAEPELPEEAPGLVHREGRDFDDRASAHAHGGALGPQARAPAALAAGIADEARVPALGALRARLLETPRQSRNHALPAHLERSVAGLARPAHPEDALAGAPEQKIPLAFGELAPGAVHLDPQLLTDLPAEAVDPAGLRRDLRPPRLDRAPIERERLVGHDEFGVDLDA